MSKFLPEFLQEFLQEQEFLSGSPEFLNPELQEFLIPVGVTGIPECLNFRN
jgi:hypothetical protein